MLTTAMNPSVVIPIDTSSSLPVSASRGRSLGKEEAWAKIVQALERFRTAAALNGREERQVRVAVTVLTTEQTVYKRKRYQRFLKEVLAVGSRFVLLCAIAFGDAQASILKASVRRELLQHIEDKKSYASMNPPHLQMLVAQYKVHKSLKGRRQLFTRGHHSQSPRHSDPFGSTQDVS